MVGRQNDSMGMFANACGDICLVGPCLYADMVSQSVGMGSSMSSEETRGGGRCLFVCARGGGGCLFVCARGGGGGGGGLSFCVRTRVQ